MLTFITVSFLLGSAAQAQTKLIAENTYDSSDSEQEKVKSFTAKVRVVREDSDGMEIFFEGEKAKGAYSLPNSAEHYSTMLKDLEKSRKPQGPAVSVTVDSEKRIKSVELKKGEDESQKKIDIKKIIDSL
ncbi:MAG: hypothetical protein ACXVCP_17510 [Bdellovibrio sp.]